MSDFGWGALCVALLVVVGWFFRLVWHGGNESNGLKGELEERVRLLESENVTLRDENATLRQELRRQANRWIP